MIAKSIVQNRHSKTNNLCEDLGLAKDNTYFLLAGDLNARHIKFGDKRNNSRGYALKNWDTINAAKFKVSLIHTLEPSFPSSRSFIDLVMVDTRINISNLVQNKIQTAAYDSDHRTLMLQIILPDNAKPTTKPPRPNTFTYKKTKWKKFSNKLQKNNRIQIPDDTNLDKTQIDSYMNKLMLHN